MYHEFRWQPHHFINIGDGQIAVTAVTLTKLVSEVTLSTENVC